MSFGPRSGTKRGQNEWISRNLQFWGFWGGAQVRISTYVRKNDVSPWIKCDWARNGVFECHFDPDPAGIGLKMGESAGIGLFGDFGGYARSNSALLAEKVGSLHGGSVIPSGSGVYGMIKA